MAPAIRGSAWTISLAIHAATTLALLVMLGAGRHDASGPPVARLVYVEPIAPPALGAPASAPRDAAAPEEPAVPLVHARRQNVERPSPVPAISRARREAVREPATAAAPETPPNRASGVVGDGGDSLGGTALGRSGGTIGGLGDAPLPLRNVAAPPELVDRVLPEYPARARAMQIEGQVVLEVVLDRTGKIEDSVRVTRSVPALDAAAIAAVRQWRFRPARDRRGGAVRVVMEIPVRFVLR